MWKQLRVNAKIKKNSTCMGKTALTVFKLRRRLSHVGQENPPNPCSTVVLLEQP
jgi:hypothetical protein